MFDNGRVANYYICVGRFPSPALFEQPLNDVGYRSDEVQNGGDQDDALQGLILVAVFLLPCHYYLLSFICQSVSPPDIIDYTSF